MATARAVTRTLGATLDQAFPVSREAELVGQLQAGCERAFADLLATYQHPIYDLILRLLGNEADAADVLQNVLVKIFRGIRQFHGDSSLKTWIYRIAVREASNHRRGWSRRQTHEAVSLDDGGNGLAAHGEPSARDDTPYQALEQAERHELVERALASLTEPYRTVVMLREMQDLSYEEIAQVLGVAAGTVKSRLLRGRELLRRKLAAGPLAPVQQSE